MDLLIAFSWLGVALIAGKLLRKAFPFFKKLFIPSSILGGLLLLLFGPEVFGALSGIEVFSEEALGIWGSIPGFMINIVFAALFLGKSLPKISQIWQKAGPQVAFSHTVAWGQYVVGLGITALVLIPFFAVEPMFGTLIEIGFIGGHGTAAGLGETFAELGWPQGQDLALGVATLGVVLGIVTGIILVNWGVKRKHTTILNSSEQTAADIVQAQEAHESVENDLINRGQADEPAPKVVQIESIEPLTFHLAYIGAAIGIGALILGALTWLEKQFLIPLGAPVLLGHVPLFPIAMIGGIIVEKLHHVFFKGGLDRVMVMRIQGSALDLLIVSALASLAISAIAQAWLPLLILVLAGIAWTVAAFMFIAPKMMRSHWFERAIGDFGQSLGVTATGLLLMRIVDPNNDTPAFESFGYKQLLFEPLVGGGLFTAVSAPLVFTFGLYPMLIITSVIMVFWLLLGLKLGKKGKVKSNPQQNEPVSEMVGNKEHSYS
ncbi:Sodium/glutamate symporter [Chitinispirillum alkaliphilum]|nr:Sodium/glutamate symporter [Chitinispirillum alkaliphilum]